METTSTPAVLRKETVNGNVRFRLYEFETERGTKYGVELSAFSSFADQWKLQQFVAGLDLQTATELFNGFAGDVGGYCWMDDEYLPKGEQ